ncbi:MAG: N-acetylmuramic acid 6-phosphate etherase, partial [Verrucomicrobiales bacterium]|nr:N-acetylmuramic acid 6-phosphate etherase [Verrucomicrobiales bacterium]
LNILTTLAMVSLGKVMGNLMVDLNPSNTKLRDRAVRIVRELTGATESEASEALHAAGWNVRKAIEALRTRAARRPKL